MMKILNQDEFMQLSELVSDASVAQERAFVVLNEMENHYFELENEAMFLHFRKDARIQADIALDYLSRMGERCTRSKRCYVRVRRPAGRRTYDKA